MVGAGPGLAAQAKATVAVDDAQGRPRGGAGSATAVVDMDRLPPSVVKILVGALAAIARRGSRRTTMSDICDASGVSRGTLYKYFSSKEEVLVAVAEYISLSFERGVRAVAEGIEDPLERLRVVLEFHANLTIEQEADRLLAIEPDFLVAFFQSHFVRHSAALADALGPVFNYFDRQTGATIDRQAACEAMVRIYLSSALVPPNAGLSRIPDLFAQVLNAIVPAAARSSGALGEPG